MYIKVWDIDVYKNKYALRISLYLLQTCFQKINTLCIFLKQKYVKSDHIMGIYAYTYYNNYMLVSNVCTYRITYYVKRVCNMQYRITDNIILSRGAHISVILNFRVFYFYNDQHVYNKQSYQNIN